MKPLRRSAAVTRNCGRAASFNLQYVVTRPAKANTRAHTVFCSFSVCVILLGELRGRCLMFVWVSVLVFVFGVRDESNSD